MEWFKKIFRRITCTHENKRYIEYYIEKTTDGRYVVRQICICDDCGKELWSKIKYKK